MTGCGGLFASAMPGLMGLGITGSDPATKMFRPVPAYLICSLWRNRSRSSVGSSRGSKCLTDFPADLRCTGRGPFAEDNCVAVGVAAGAGSDGQNILPTEITATNPSAAAAITFVRFSAPSFTMHQTANSYAP